MREHKIEETELIPDPENSNWTKPKSYGVWMLPSESSGKKYRYGNNPIRGIELIREFGSAQRLTLYTSREAAKKHADELNR